MLWSNLNVAKFPPTKRFSKPLVVMNNQWSMFNHKMWVVETWICVLENLVKHKMKRDKALVPSEESFNVAAQKWIWMDLLIQVTRQDMLRSSDSLSIFRSPFSPRQLWLINKHAPKVRTVRESGRRVWKTPWSRPESHEKKVEQRSEQCGTTGMVLMSSWVLLHTYTFL